VKIIKMIKGTANEVRLNPNVGTWSWLLHRISGLLLLVYLFMHLWVLGSANSGAAAFDLRLKTVQSPLFHFLEIGLILVIFYHMVNGIAVTVMDFADISSKHKAVVTAMVTVFAILAIVTLVVLLPRVLGGAHVSIGGTA
jgi:succinate dehydrogenase / fumarate reductase cytochrome b subunit